MNQNLCIFWPVFFVHLCVCVTHPMFYSLGGMSSFLLGVVMGQHVNQAHEVHLPLGRTYSTAVTGAVYKKIWDDIDLIHD